VASRALGLYVCCMYDTVGGGGGDDDDDDDDDDLDDPDDSDIDDDVPSDYKDRHSKRPSIVTVPNDPFKASAVMTSKLHR